MTGIVYRYVLQVPGDENGWSYIGETIDPENRRRNWEKPNVKYYAGGKIGKAREKYGTAPDVWTYEVLEEIEDSNIDALKQKLIERETYYITFYNSSEKGFNTSLGGTGNKGVYFSKEWREHIGNASRGRRHSEETKKRISEKLKGRTIPDEIRKKISAGNKGRKLTSEQCAAISERMKGKVMSPEARAKSSATKKGKPHPISPQGMANINAHRYKIGINAIDHEGNQVEFVSLSEAAGYFKISVAAVSHLLKTGNYGKHGYRFIKK